MAVCETQPCKSALGPGSSCRKRRSPGRGRAWHVDEFRQSQRGSSTSGSTLRLLLASCARFPSRSSLSRLLCRLQGVFLRLALHLAPKSMHTFSTNVVQALLLCPPYLACCHLWTRGHSGTRLLRAVWSCSFVEET